MKVLLGLEASESGYRALEETLERAAEAGDDLTVALYGEPSDRDDLAASVRDRRSADDAAADVVELDGQPGPALVQLSEEGDYDRLVIAGGQLSPMGKIKLGSVAEFVLTNARTTITLVR